MLVTPVKISPAGIGGYVGHHSDPHGDVLGRRITARVNMSVAAASAATLDAEVQRVTHTVLSAARRELAQLGILKLSLLEVGPRPAVTTGGPPTTPRRDVAFDVLYEFLKLPESAGGVIQTIPLDIESALSANEPRMLLSGPFVADPLANFDIIDDPAATTAAPSSWSFDAVLQGIRQTSAIRGGPDTAAPNQPGTYLLLRATPARPLVRDFSLAASMDATVIGGIGFVFRFSDVDNFYYALLDSRTGFRRIGKKIGGAFAALQQGGLDDSAGFQVDTLMRVRLVAEGAAFRLLIDGEVALEAQDDQLTSAGRVGLMVRHCAGARFFDFTLLLL
jgi:hypothetical protein